MTATKIHPLTGRPLKPIFISQRTGRVYWPILGGSETVVETPPDTVTIPVPPPAPAPPRTFTAEEIAKARQEEKDKLYPRIEELTGKVSEFDNWKSQFEKEKEAQTAAAVEAARKKAEEEAAVKFAESDAKTLLKEAEDRWNLKFQEQEQARELERAIFAKEQEFNTLKEYANTKVNAALQSNEIAPELAPFVTGNTEAEIDASLEFVKGQTAKIVENLQNAQVQQRSQMPGVSTTGFATTGPMDTEPGHKTYTPEELYNMPMSEFANNRQALLGAAAQRQSSKGMYG